MPSHTEAERRKVRALISRPINSLSGVEKQRAKIRRKTLNLKANRPALPRIRPSISTVIPPPKPIIRETKPTDITGKAQSTADLIRKRQRLLKNF